MLQMLEKILTILESQQLEKEEDLVDHINEIIQFNPEFFGVSVDINALFAKIKNKWLQR